MSTVKLKRGQKICKSCGNINPSRSRTCKHCSSDFSFKNIPVKNEILDWRNIEVGAYIKVIRGTGPYFICNKDSDEMLKGERIHMGHTGVFKIVGKDQNGLKANGVSSKNSGFSYLYMGDPKRSKMTGIYWESYRIKKANFKGKR